MTGTDDLQAKLLGRLRSLQKRPHVIRSFFKAPHIRYTTAWVDVIVTYGRLIYPT